MVTQWLVNSGCERVFAVNNKTREGIDELREYLMETPVRLSLEEAKMRQRDGLPAWDAESPEE